MNALVPLLLALPLVVAPQEPETDAVGLRLVYAFELPQDPGSAAVTERLLDLLRARAAALRLEGRSIELTGDGRLVVEGELARPDGAVTARLARALAEDEARLELDPDSADRLPARSAVVAVGEEWIHYRRRAGAHLLGLERGYLGTTAAAHAPSATVALVGRDPWRELCERRGELAFEIVAELTDLAGVSRAELGERRAELERRMDAQGGLRVPPPAPGEQRLAGVRWAWGTRLDGKVELLPLLAPEQAGGRFGSTELARVYATADDWGLPALGFELDGASRAAFRSFTATHVDRRLALRLDDEVLTVPTIAEPLSGAGIIRPGLEGRFADAELECLVALVEHGPLPVTLELVRVEAR